MGIESTYSQLNLGFFMGPQWDYSCSKSRLNSLLQLRLEVHLQQNSHPPKYQEQTLVLSRNINHTQALHMKTLKGMKNEFKSPFQQPRVKLLFPFNLQTGFLLHHQQPEFWLAQNLILASAEVNGNFPWMLNRPLLQPNSRIPCLTITEHGMWDSTMTYIIK